MMEFQCGVIAIIAAPAAGAPHLFNQSYLSPPTPLLLRLIRLMVQVQYDVFALPRTIFSLSADQYLSAMQAVRHPILPRLQYIDYDIDHNSL